MTQIEQYQAEQRSRIVGSYNAIPDTDFGKIEKSEENEIEKGGAGSGRQKFSVAIDKKNSAGGEKPGQYHYHARSQY